MRIFYATRDGQTRRVAERIAARLSERGIGAATYDLATAAPPTGDLVQESVVVVVAAVRYGRHLPEADRLLSALRTLPSPPALALVSVNLTARKPGKTTAEGNAYLRRWIARHRLTPVLAAAVAGRLDYPRYGWLDKVMIRLIMTLTGGPTDPRAVVDYTDWDAVDRLAGQIGDAVKGRSPPCIDADTACRPPSMGSGEGP